jgi:hypothetical protein
MRLIERSGLGAMEVLYRISMVETPMQRSTSTHTEAFRSGNIVAFAAWYAFALLLLCLFFVLFG